MFLTYLVQIFFERMANIFLREDTNSHDLEGGQFFLLYQRRRYLVVLPLFSPKPARDRTISFSGGMLGEHNELQIRIIYSEFADLVWLQSTGSSY
jgi:hypothetical protein